MCHLAEAALPPGGEAPESYPRVEGNEEYRQVSSGVLPGGMPAGHLPPGKAERKPSGNRSLGQESNSSFGCEEEDDEDDGRLSSTSGVEDEVVPEYLHPMTLLLPRCLSPTEEGWAGGWELGRG